MVSRAVPLGPDTELRIDVVEDSPAERPLLDLRLCRRSTDDTGLYPTAAGFRVPLHLAGLVAEAIRIAGQRGTVRLAQPAKCQSCDD